jgi:hypothetical protein
MSVQLLSWLGLKMFFTVVTAEGVTATRLPSQPASGPSPPLYQPLLPFGLGLCSLRVGVLIALNTGDRRCGRYPRRRGRQMEAVSCPLDALLAVSNNSYTWFPTEPKKSTKVEN